MKWKEVITLVTFEALKELITSLQFVLTQMACVYVYWLHSLTVSKCCMH